MIVDHFSIFALKYGQIFFILDFRSCQQNIPCQVWIQFITLFYNFKQFLYGFKSNFAKPICANQYLNNYNCTFHCN